MVGRSWGSIAKDARKAGVDACLGASWIRSRGSAKVVDKGRCPTNARARNLWSSRRGHGTGAAPAGLPAETATGPGGSFGRFVKAVSGPLLRAAALRAQRASGAA